MDKWTKAKEWVNENAPLLAVVYQNKYVGMAYDRFASLPAKQQKQTILGGFSGVVFLVVAYLLFSYFSLWSYSSRAGKSYDMVNVLQQYQKQRRDKSSQLQQLERNSQLAPPGELKTHLLSLARAAGISPRSAQAEEKNDAMGGEDESKGGGRDAKIKQATVVLERVNLSQLKNFLTSVEFGNYNLGVSSIKITNDDKIRGYMKAELGVVAYLFQTEEGG